MNKEDVVCPLPWHHIAIRPNGRVYPCCYFRHESTPEEFNLSHNDVFNHMLKHLVFRSIRVL